MDDAVSVVEAKVEDVRDVKFVLGDVDDESLLLFSRVVPVIVIDVVVVSVFEFTVVEPTFEVDDVEKEEEEEVADEETKLVLVGASGVESDVEVEVDVVVVVVAEVVVVVVSPRTAFTLMSQLNSSAPNSAGSASELYKTMFGCVAPNAVTAFAG